jgi:hypothetical protein
MTWGGATVSINNSGPIPGGANGTGTAFGANGTIVDYGNGAYPAFDLVAQFKSDGSVYDMGAFTGIKYFLKVGSDDTAPWRAFFIPISSTAPSTEGGTCASNCYDHFYVDYGNTNGVWTPVVRAFSDFKRQGYGNSLNPPNLTGANLKQALRLQWDESNRNAPGTIVFNVCVDEIQFY